MFFTVPHVESSPKHVRAFLEGKAIIDSRKAKLVWETPAYPVYFFPEAELPSRFLGNRDDHPDRTCWDLTVDSRCAHKAVTFYPHTVKDLGGLFTVKFDAMDSWFEEEEQIFVHPKDPYKRVDVLQSSRHVCVSVGGIEVANTHMPKFLYETGLHVRTYIPKTHCRLDLLEPSELRTRCPYKGEAQYCHIVGPSGEKKLNILWWYENPLPETAAIRGYVAFYDEKVDVWVDRELQPHSKT